MKTNLCLGSKKKHLLAFIILLLNVINANAQQKNYQGQIKDNEGPLLGAQITIKGTQQTTLSDFDGNFELTTTPNKTIVITYLGYLTKEVVLSNNNSNIIKIQLERDVQSLDAVQLIGYGKQKKKEITGAVANVTSEELIQTATSDLGTAIQGKVAGVNIQAQNGSPGEPANIQIRGVGSLTAGALGPLYVVDGIPYEDNPNIAPNQIESIDILKDGASAAIYGTRASNGVILITTKKGEAGKTRVNFTSYVGIQNITSGTPLMNTDQQMYQIQQRNALNNTSFDPFSLNPEALDFNTNYIESIQNNNSIIENYSLNISGGTKAVKLNYNTTYFNQDGVLKGSGFNRLANRLTAQYNKGKFKMFTSLGYTNENRDREPFNIYEQSIKQMPYGRPLSDPSDISVIDGDGDGIVSVFAALFGNTNETETHKNNIALNLQYEILEGLTYKVNLGYNNFNSLQKRFFPRFLSFNSQGDLNASSVLNARLIEDHVISKRQSIENILNYNTSFGANKKHKVGLLAVLSYEKFKSKTSSTGVIFDKNVPNNNVQVLSGGAEAIKPTGTDINRTLSGKLFRGQYNYDDKYLFSGSIRRDGSSRFQGDNKHGTFFGLSAGWNLHEENFLKNISEISNLKLRASYAEVGNQSTRDYATSSIVESGINYPFATSESLAIGNIQRRITNENLKWETTISKNIGIDLALFKNKLSMNFDYYENNKNDMLLLKELPGSAGTSQTDAVNQYGVVAVNAGNMTNKGIEFALNYRNQIKDLKYTISYTLTKNVNEVTNLDGLERGYGGGVPFTEGNQNADNTTYYAVGHEAGAFFLLQNQGVIKTQEQLDAYQQIDSGAQLGDLMYKDQNGDSKIDDNDLVYSGSGQADFESGLNIGLNYKNFDFNAQTYFSSGAEIYNGAKLFAYRVRRHQDLYSMWTPQNPNSNIPTERSLTSENVRSRSDYFLEDGTYLRIRNLTLGYTIPNLEKLNIKKARLYISSVNPFTFTKYSGYDPEIGGDGLLTRGVDKGNYPITRQFLLGIQANF
ncbi:SusC/RagA family TonB-linked outer membrane protein [Wenyingzhuangia aestuarii]|uniref:SusC/RagA family TonB-linked outer membrane protein n=1 Tax=Wenyingzhuangia aestuarii TaxID=1647582 RepID=UPI001438E86C|nr:TonB-dependent receptor [Wenyingzhuangia aestuarii]NJB83504.1 TonB-linked SusC/RagA family outer membrane protein [Wenyingzhuangia aestuarii]